MAIRSSPGLPFPFYSPLNNPLQDISFYKQRYNRANPYTAPLKRQSGSGIVNPLSAHSTSSFKPSLELSPVPPLPMTIPTLYSTASPAINPARKQRPIQRTLEVRPMENEKFWTHFSLQIEGLDELADGYTIMAPFRSYKARFILLPFQTASSSTQQKYNKGYAFIFFKNVEERDAAIKAFEDKMTIAPVDLVDNEDEFMLDDGAYMGSGGIDGVCGRYSSSEEVSDEPAEDVFWWDSLVSSSLRDLETDV